jgi:hypothetical protein
LIFASHFSILLTFYFGDEMQMMESSLVKKVSNTTESLLRQALWIMGYAVVTAIGAQLEIPHYPVPFTTQTFLCFVLAFF